MCQECAGYKRGEQCEDECPTDHYADEEQRECFACHNECRGCTDAGSDNCMSCRNFKLYVGDANDNSTTFNCTAVCPKEFPYKVYSLDQPYCSAISLKSGLSSADSAETPIYLALAFIVLVLLFGVLIISSLHCRQKAKIKKETMNLTRVMTGCEDTEPLRPSNMAPNLNKMKVIDKGRLSIGRQLGEGAFGNVRTGTWKCEGGNVPVAIKTLTNTNGNISDLSKEFMNEAVIMTTVNHENLLHLLGICMADELMLITQLMPLGSLLEFVKKHKNEIKAHNLLKWSTQIAKGMAYLEKIRLVHRDLAARNVLVRNWFQVKITDFGLAQLLRSDSNVYQATGGKLPIKWLALECLFDQTFTSKSDVWAFGVTIWEAITFGRQPYENIKPRDVPAKIKTGHRLEQPDICSVEIYCLLLSCWQCDPNQRPTFETLANQFTDYAKDPARYLVIHEDHGDKDNMRTLTRQQANHSKLAGDSDGFSHSELFPQSMAGPSNMQAIKLHNLNRIPGDDETDSKRDLGLSIRLDLPLDEDDYLIPTCQNEANGMPGYVDVIGSPACVDNPEYLMGSMGPIATSSSSTTSSQPLHSPPPTQTIGIPVSPMENGEHASDHEYYNDLHREVQPLQRNETTV